jgi:hypothetical protein
MAAARSVAPGEAKVDARTVIAHAASQKARMATQPAPPAGQGATIIGAVAPPAGSKSRQLQVPGLVGPQQPKHNTMRIGTPQGYSSRPPRKYWPIVLVIGLVAGLGGGAFAVAWFGRSNSAEETELDAATESTAGPGSSVSAVVRDTGSVSSTVAASGSGSASAPPPPAIDAAVAEVAAVDAAAAPPAIDAAVADPPARFVRVTLESSPEGANVIGPDGTSLGKTPLKLEWPAGEQPVAFVLKLKGYKDKSTEVTVTSNSMTRVELDRIPVNRPTGTGSGSGKGSGKPPGDGLIRPDDL